MSAPARRRPAAVAATALAVVALAGCTGVEAPPEGLAGRPAAAPAAPAAKPGEVDLAWRFREGETLCYRVVHRAAAVGQGLPAIRVGDVEVPVEGRLDTDRTLDLDVRLRVISVSPGGTAALAASYEAVRFRLTGSLGEVTFDSAHRDRGPAPAPGSPGEAIRKGLARLLEESIGLELEPSGRLAAASAASLVSYDPWREPQAAAHDLAAGFGLLPGRPVPVGATWTDTRVHEALLGRLALDDAYALVAVGGTAGTPGLARIEARTEGRLDSIGGGFDLVSARGSETVDFDVAAGRVRSSVRRLQFELARPGAPDVPESERSFLRVEAERTAELVP